MTSCFLLALRPIYGDGKIDRAIVDPATGRWFVIPSSGVSPDTLGIPWAWQWDGMTSSHLLALGDYDGDGKIDRAIVDPATGRWFVIPSSGVSPDTLVIP